MVHQVMNRARTAPAMGARMPTSGRGGGDSLNQPCRNSVAAARNRVSPNQTTIRRRMRENMSIVGLRIVDFRLLLAPWPEDNPFVASRQSLTAHHSPLTTFCPRAQALPGHARPGSSASRISREAELRERAVPGTAWDRENHEPRTPHHAPRTTHHFLVAFTSHPS